MSNLNALKHGCCATEHIILPNENPADFERLKRNWYNEYAPQSEFEQDILNAAIEANWNLQRANRHVRNMRAKLYAETPDETEWTEDQHRKLNRFIRYQTRYTNELNQYRRLLESRKRQAAKTEQAQHKSEATQKKQTLEKKLALVKAKSQYGLNTYEDLLKLKNSL